MKKELNIVLLLLVFFISWIVLFGLYQGYLYHFNHHLEQIDPITHWVAVQSESFLNFLRYPTEVVSQAGVFYDWLYIEGEYATIVNEGCNGVSVALALIAFVLAFHQQWKTTFLFLVLSLLIFTVVNIGRVAWLSYIYRYDNKHFKIAHDLFFPGIIYGYVLLCWVVWMKFFVLNKEE